MTDPFDPFALQPTPVDDFVVPNHEASTEGSTLEPAKAATVRERLMGNSGRARGRPRGSTNAVKEKKPAPPNKPGQYVKPMEELYTTIGLFAMPFHPSFAMTMLGPCSTPIEGQPEPDSVATNCAKAWDAAAQKSETIRRMLDGFMTASTAGLLVAAHAPLFMALASGTKLDPAVAMEKFLARQQKEEQDSE